MTIKYILAKDKAHRKKPLCLMHSGFSVIEIDFDIKKAVPRKGTA